GFAFEILAPTYLSGAFVTASELIQANLKEVGIDATIKTADAATHTAAQMAGNFQAATLSIGGRDLNSWLASIYKTGAGQNYAKYSSPEVDKLIEQQASLVKDPEGRKKIIQDIQRKVISDAVYIPILFFQSPFVTVPELTDYY